MVTKLLTYLSALMLGIGAFGVWFFNELERAKDWVGGAGPDRGFRLMSITGLWALVVLVGISIVANAVVGMRVEDRLDEIHFTALDTKWAVKDIQGADVLKLEAVMMKNSQTWTLPVSSITWSGR